MFGLLEYIKHISLFNVILENGIKDKTCHEQPGFTIGQSYCDENCEFQKIISDRYHAN